MKIRNLYNIGQRDLWTLFEKLGLYGQDRERFDDITCEWISEDEFIRTANTIAKDYPISASMNNDAAYYGAQLLSIAEVMQEVGVA